MQNTFLCNHISLKIFLKGQGGNFAQINCPPQDTRGIPEVVSV